MIDIIKNNIQTLIVAAVLLLSSIGIVAAGMPAYAANENIQGSINCGANINLNGDPKKCEANNKANDGSGRLQNLIEKIINILSVIVGVVAVIMIIWGGFKFITSGGDSNSVASAKSTIVYAIVGLIIVALAQVIVRFVLSAL